MIKFLFDYFPIICFFIAYKFYGIYVATLVTMIASALQLAAYWLIHRRFEKLHVITFILIMILGSATLIFHKVIFIKWKPTLIYWAFFIVLTGSHFIGKKTVAHRMLGDKIAIPTNIWKRINIAWAIFFLILGFVNLYVVYHYDTNAWVNFKLFGTLGLTFAFILLQVAYMWRYIERE